MNVAELQIRLKAFAYRIVVSCESLPLKKTSKITEDQGWSTAYSAAANYRAARRARSDKAFKAKLSLALEEIDETLLNLEAIVDIKLIPAVNLAIVVADVDELTRILASLRMCLENKSGLSY